MNDRECLRTSTNVWRSLCDHCELMANCIRKPIRHTFATGETRMTFETPQKRPRMLTNSDECLAISCDHYEFTANCIRKPFAIYSPQCETSISEDIGVCLSPTLTPALPLLDLHVEPSQAARPDTCHDFNLIL